MYINDYRYSLPTTECGHFADDISSHPHNIENIIFSYFLLWLANIFFDQDNTVVQSMLFVNQINLNSRVLYYVCLTFVISEKYYQ